MFNGSLGSSNIKVIGIVKGTRTGLPFIFPGVIFGSFDIILYASLSRFLSGPMALILVTELSVSIINWT